MRSSATLRPTSACIIKIARGSFLENSSAETPCGARGRTKNANIRVAVQRNSVDLQLAIPNLAERARKGIVMNAIAAVQQRAVNVEQVGVEAVPGKRRS